MTPTWGSVDPNIGSAPDVAAPTLPYVRPVLTTPTNQGAHMFHITKRTLTAATMIAAAAAPSTAAAHFDLQPSSGAVVARPAAPVAAQPPAASPDGFQWGDAGIGAAAALGLIGATGATAVLIRRRREEQTPTA